MDDLKEWMQKTAIVERAVRAGCEWGDRGLRERGVITIATHCAYPHCRCITIPGQIKAALDEANKTALAQWRAEWDKTREPDAP